MTLTTSPPAGNPVIPLTTFLTAVWCSPAADSDTIVGVNDVLTEEDDARLSGMPLVTMPAPLTAMLVMTVSGVPAAEADMMELSGTTIVDGTLLMLGRQDVFNGVVISVLEAGARHVWTVAGAVLRR